MRDTLHDKPFIQKWAEGDAEHRKALESFLTAEIALKPTQEPLRGEGEPCIYEADFGKGKKERKPGLFISDGGMFASFTSHGYILWLLEDLNDGERLSAPLRYESGTLWDVRNLIKGDKGEEITANAEAIADLEEILADHETLIRNLGAKKEKSLYRHSISLNDGQYHICFDILNADPNPLGREGIIEALPGYDEGVFPCSANHISILGVCRDLDGQGDDHIMAVSSLNQDGTPMTAGKYYFTDAQACEYIKEVR